MEPWLPRDLLSYSSRSKMAKSLDGHIMGQ
jgi:hypothetical protein